MIQKRGIMVALYGYYGYGYYYDPMYILIIISCVIALIAQVKVKSTFNKYSKVSSSKGMTGAMVAEQLLRSQGIYDVSIQRVSGSLTDASTLKDIKNVKGDETFKASGDT